jgi:hypothetical protein
MKRVLTFQVEPARAMQPGGTYPLDYHRDRLPGAETPRLPVRALLFLRLECHEGISLFDATGPHVQHHGPILGTACQATERHWNQRSDLVRSPNHSRPMAGSCLDQRASRRFIPAPTGLARRPSIWPR